MSHTEAGLDVLHRVLLALLVCLALLLLVGCSGDPECFAASFLPKCFDDDDDEEKQPDNMAPQATSLLVTPPWLREAVARAIGHRHAAMQTPASAYHQAPRILSPLFSAGAGGGAGVL